MVRYLHCGIFMQFGLVEILLFVQPFYTNLVAGGVMDKAVAYNAGGPGSNKDPVTMIIA